MYSLQIYIENVDEEKVFYDKVQEEIKSAPVHTVLSIDRGMNANIRLP